MYNSKISFFSLLLESQLPGFVVNQVCKHSQFSHQQMPTAGTVALSAKALLFRCAISHDGSAWGDGLFRYGRL